MENITFRLATVWADPGRTRSNTGSLAPAVGLGIRIRSTCLRPAIAFGSKRRVVASSVSGGSKARPESAPDFKIKTGDGRGVNLRSMCLHPQPTIESF